MISLGLQLYSLREMAEKDLALVIKTAADLGFRGIEPAGFFNLDALRVKALCDDMGLEIPSSHSPWIRSVDDVHAAVDVANIFGSDYVCTGFMEDAFTDREKTKRTAQLVNEMQRLVEREGKHLFLHNHWWEFDEKEGVLPYDLLVQESPDVLLELDVYWASNFGKFNAADLVRKYQQRIPFLHLKDGSLKKGDAMQALGSGALDIPSIVEACDESVTSYIIVELDTCDTDMVEALRRSSEYMIRQGLALGKDNQK